MTPLCGMHKLRGDAERTEGAGETLGKLSRLACGKIQTQENDFRGGGGGVWAGGPGHTDWLLANILYVLLCRQKAHPFVKNSQTN